MLLKRTTLLIARLSIKFSSGFGASGGFGRQACAHFQGGPSQADLRAQGELRIFKGGFLHGERARRSFDHGQHQFFGFNQVRELLGDGESIAHGGVVVEAVGGLHNADYWVGCEHGVVFAVALLVAPEGFGEQFDLRGQGLAESALDFLVGNIVVFAGIVEHRASDRHGRIGQMGFERAQIMGDADLVDHFRAAILAPARMDREGVFEGVEGQGPWRGNLGFKARGRYPSQKPVPHGGGGFFKFPLLSSALVHDASYVASSYHKLALRAALRKFMLVFCGLASSKHPVGAPPHGCGAPCR